MKPKFDGLNGSIITKHDILLSILHSPTNPFPNHARPPARARSATEIALAKFFAVDNADAVAAEAAAPSLATPPKHQVIKKMDMTDSTMYFSAPNVGDEYK